MAQHVLPNPMGIPDANLTGVTRPNDSSWIGALQDENVLKDVLLLVYINPAKQDPTDWHWSINWVINNNYMNCVYHRVIHIVHEKDLKHLNADLPYLTNWGPMTRMIGGQTIDAIGNAVVIASLTLKQRQDLEKIAASTPVQEPDGHWNCQDWTKTVLATAVTSGLLIKPQVDDALSRAKLVQK